MIVEAMKYANKLEDAIRFAPRPGQQLLNENVVPCQ